MSLIPLDLSSLQNRISAVPYPSLIVLADAEAMWSLTTCPNDRATIDNKRGLQKLAKHIVQLR